MSESLGLSNISRKYEAMDRGKAEGVQSWKRTETALDTPPRCSAPAVSWLTHRTLEPGVAGAVLPFARGQGVPLRPGLQCRGRSERGAHDDNGPAHCGRHQLHHLLEQLWLEVCESLHASSTTWHAPESRPLLRKPPLALQFDSVVCHTFSFVCLQLVAQDRSQKYKEGKFILERSKLIDSTKRSRQSTDSQEYQEMNETGSESDDPCT